MTEMDIVSPELLKDAEYVNSAWKRASQSRLEGIFETGRRLIEVRRKYQDADGEWLEERKGEWSRLIGDNQWRGDSLLHFQKTQTNQLIRVAACKRLPRHAGVLPDDGTILSKLVSLSDEKFEELIEDGTINPKMGRNDMSDLKVSKKAWVQTVPSQNGARLTAIDSVTAEHLVDQCLSKEAANIDVPDIIREIDTNTSSYQMLKSIVLVGRCNYLSPIDRHHADHALADLNEHKQVAPVFEQLAPVIKHMWGESRGMKGRDADVERRHKEFNRVIRLIKNTCESALEIDIPYLNVDQIKDTKKSLGEAIKSLNQLKSHITDLHE